MEKELGEGNKKPEILEKLAQYELTLLDWVDEHKGYRKYVAISGFLLPSPSSFSISFTTSGILSVSYTHLVSLSEPASARMQ